ncbi:MGH1-like glycoside hydrolase domain-containing protein [Luteococcus peritonei]|uniref:Glycogen debranching N-terminal domain-containing protein n=1 Tax=Luteococcus peritonei TaxID=88874 RepID=A0ABW4RY64_9ACTN
MQQPFLNSRCAVVAAPVQAWSAPDGQADGLAALRDVEGVFCGDTRIASQLLLGSPSHALEHIATDERGGARVRFQYVLRTPELGVDPALVLERIREVTTSGVRERYVLTTASLQDLEVDLELVLRPDATGMQAVKGGETPSPLPAEQLGDPTGGWSWRDERTSARLRTDATVSSDDGAWRLRWRLRVPARGVADAGWQLELRDEGLPFVGASAEPLALPALTDASPSLRRLVEHSFADINGLRLAHPSMPEHTFLAAGAPWYFTLFGRDSLIAARNLLAHDLGVATGTLKVLARLQGTVVDVDRAEQPGKILHEVRQETLELALGHLPTDDSDGSAHISLPPLYYGTIDATPLWIMLLGEAEERGLDEATVRELLPNLRAALGWLADHGDADGDGFLEYRDESGHGLANQGWKDSGDSVRFADGSLAKGSVALAEVQGYAHAAALHGARLLARYEADTEAAAFWTGWAEQLATRFREHFWAADELGRYPVLALDGDKRQVTGVASNMGHLLGTGILTDSEAETVVERLVHPSMASGYGVRTMSETNGGYWPLSYHVGSVWTHDTAFIIDGMLREGFDEQARELAAALLRAAEGFGYRMPELFGGMAADAVFPPQPYPASCRPQAWAATSAVVVARALGALPG